MTPPASYLITVATEHLRSAGNEPARVWPAFSVLFPVGNSREVIHDPIFRAEDFWSVAADFGWVAGAAMDPLAPALEAAKAAMVHPGELRALDETARLIRRLVG